MRAPQLPIVANVTGEFYPERASTEDMLEICSAGRSPSPVQFVKGLHTLYDAGARVFVEVGPKRALHGFVEDVLGSQHDDVLALFTNHPKLGDVASFNQALCGLYAAGLGLAPVASPAAAPATAPTPASRLPPQLHRVAAPAAPAASRHHVRPHPARIPMSTARYEELGRLFADVLEQGLRVVLRRARRRRRAGATGGPTQVSTAPVVITGAALGLPGVDRVFDDDNLARILAGQQFIDVDPAPLPRGDGRHAHHPAGQERGRADPRSRRSTTRPRSSSSPAAAHPWTSWRSSASTPPATRPSTRTTRLAIGAGFDALRDAGIPLVMRYKTTTLGTQLPDRWGLPEAMRDDTGVIFASAFPGLRRVRRGHRGYMTDRARREQVLALEGVARPDDRRPSRLPPRSTGASPSCATCSRPSAYEFDRRFLFRCLSMGHSQFAEIIGARGPNTQINAACASTTQAVSLAEDWIRAGRCRRVVVVSADDVTSDALLPWIGSGFLATGAAATDDDVEEAATPFDRRRHGMIVGMGAAAFVVESAEAARERGLQPICEVLGSVTANSAFHGTRLDVEHIGEVMESLVRTRRGARRRPHADRPADGVRLARDLHPGPRRLGRGRDQRAAPRLRRRRRARS